MPPFSVRLRVAVVLSSVLLPASTSTLRAQDKSWLQHNDRGTRYEGLVDRPNAKRDYEVLGLFAGKELSGTLPRSARLHILYFVPKNAGVASITVKELRSETQYLMEPKPEKLSTVRAGAWNVFDDWPVGEVIAPNHVALDNLGVLVRLQDDAEPGMLSPAIVYASEPPKAIGAYVVEFVSHRRLKGVTCTATDERGVSTRCAVPGTVLESSVPVEFSVAARALRPGRMTVRIEGEYANTMGERLLAELHFVHEKLPD